MAQLDPVVIIAGPTASGKSALALEIARQFDGEIVNADSMQVYQELSVLTARPTVADEAQVPHHLYGVVPAEIACSAGKWLEMAVTKIRDIHNRKKLPVVCGGTGLYLKVLREGMAGVPDIPNHIVADTEALFVQLGGELFLNKLAEIDPQSAARLAPSDRQRLVRAYSVAQATGKCLSDWHATQSTEQPINARFFVVHLMPDRASLYQKIEHRFDQMVKQGGIKEIEALSAMALSPSLPAMKALGVPEFLEVVAGTMSIEGAIDQAKKTTRNLAKRQFTWFRNQGESDLVVHDFGPNALQLGLSAVSGFLSDTG